MIDVDVEKDAGSSLQSVQWVEAGCNNDTNIASLTSKKGNEIEQCFSLAALLQSRSTDQNRVLSPQVDGEGMEWKHYLSFDCFRIDTSVNRTSAISTGQYHAC